MRRENRYLKDKARQRYDRARGRRDMNYRDMERRDYRSDYRREEDYRNDYENDYKRGVKGTGFYGRDYENGDMQDYYDREMDFMDDKMESLKRKLEEKDKFRMTKNQVISQARSNGAKFNEYDEDEFYLTYLMMCCDYKDVSNDPMMFIKMAKAFLEDDDIAVSPSEKLSIYIDKIVMGE